MNFQNNKQNNKHPSLLFALTFLVTGLCSTVNADQISDPDVSQKAAIEHMHHKLHNDQASHKAKEAKALKELNEMTITEGVKLKAINAKIDELMAAKTMILQLRYAHLVEMRQILTDEQRVAYDVGVLKRSVVK